jgi:type VI secretion system protein ImpK
MRVPAADGALMAYFRAFYADLMTTREALESGRTLPGGIVSATSEVQQSIEGAAVEVSAATVAAGLANILEQQALEVARQGGALAAERYQEAQYVMAALADELFLHEIQWAGGAHWAEHLLERRLFGTYDAGQQVFRRAAAILDERGHSDRELAMVYFSALGLRFMGQHRGAANPIELEGLKRSLYRLIFGAAPGLDAADRRVSPAAYAHTLRNGSRRDLPTLGRWLKVGLVVGGVLLLISHLVFSDAVRNLDRELQRPIWSEHR